MSKQECTRGCCPGKNCSAYGCCCGCMRSKPLNKSSYPGVQSQNARQTFTPRLPIPTYQMQMQQQSCPGPQLKPRVQNFNNSPTNNQALQCPSYYSGVATTIETSQTNKCRIDCSEMPKTLCSTCAFNVPTPDDSTNCVPSCTGIQQPEGDNKCRQGCPGMSSSLDSNSNFCPPTGPCGRQLLNEGDYRSSRSAVPSETQYQPCRSGNLPPKCAPSCIGLPSTKQNQCQPGCTGIPPSIIETKCAPSCPGLSSTKQTQCQPGCTGIPAPANGTNGNQGTNKCPPCCPGPCLAWPRTENKYQSTTGLSSIINKNGCRQGCPGLPSPGDGNKFSSGEEMQGRSQYRPCCPEPVNKISGRPGCRPCCPGLSEPIPSETPPPVPCCCPCVAQCPLCCRCQEMASKETKKTCGTECPGVEKQCQTEKPEPPPTLVPCCSKMCRIDPTASAKECTCTCTTNGATKKGTDNKNDDTKKVKEGKKEKKSSKTEVKKKRSRGCHCSKTDVNKRGGSCHCSRSDVKETGGSCHCSGYKKDEKKKKEKREVWKCFCN